MRKSINSKIPALRFRDFSDSWKEVHIADIAEVFSGGTPDTTNKELWGNDIEWFTPTEVGKTKYVHQSKRKLSYLGLQKSSAKLLSPGTILLSTRATIGEMSITTKHASTNQGFQSLTCKPTVNNEFIYYSGRIIKRQCLVGSNGSTFLEISKKDVEKVKLRVPSILEQNMIADFFSLLDSRIESQEQIIKNLEQLKKGYMQKIFSQQLRFKDENGEDFPEWEEKEVGTFADVYQPQTITISNLTTGNYRVFGANGYVGFINEFNHECEQVVISCRGENSGKVNYVEAKSWITGNSMVVNVDMCRNIIHKRFLYYCLQSGNLKYMVSGSGQPQITKKDVEKHSIKIPTMDEQELIVRFFNSVTDKISIEEMKLIKLQELKSGYLQQMFV